VVALGLERLRHANAFAGTSMPSKSSIDGIKV